MSAVHSTMHMSAVAKAVASVMSTEGEKKKHYEQRLSQLLEHGENLITRAYLDKGLTKDGKLIHEKQTDGHTSGHITIPGTPNTARVRREEEERRNPVLRRKREEEEEEAINIAAASNIQSQTLLYDLPNLPSIRQLKQERSTKLESINDISSYISSSYTFPLDNMINELELARIKTGDIQSVHHTVNTFFEKYPHILALLKFKLCTRWARFSVSVSTGTYNNGVENVESLGPRLGECMNSIYDAYRDAKRRYRYLNSSKANFKEESLSSSDIEIYLRWLVPNMTSRKETNRFLITLKWLAFTHANAIQNKSAEYNADIHILDRDEDLRQLQSISAPAHGSKSLKRIMKKARNALRTRKFHLYLPMIHMREHDVDVSIFRIGTNQFVTPLDYEQGHPLLSQILRVFPALFEEQSKKKWYRMNNTMNTDSMEIDRTTGIVYVKKANWLPFNRFHVNINERNILLREQLNAIGTIDSELLCEYKFINSANCDFVMQRLKHLSWSHNQRLTDRLKADIHFQANLQQNLAFIRKNHNSIASIPANPHLSNNPLDAAVVTSTPAISTPAVYFSTVSAPPTPEEWA